MKKILILDDEQAVRQSFLDYFEDHLWQTIQAESAEDALMMLQDERPQAAIVDVRLPGMDGIEFIRQLCNRELVIACVICTGSPEFDLPADFHDLAIVSNIIFKKPVSDLAELENEVSSVLAAISNGGKLNE